MGEESSSRNRLIDELLTTFVSILLIVAFILAWLYNPFYITYIHQIQSFGWMSWVYPISFELTRNIAWTNWLFNPTGIDMIKHTAWTLWAYNPAILITSLIIGIILLIIFSIFGRLPMRTFKEKGGVPPGKRYLETTKLVDSGVYAVIRHPQYTAGAILHLIPIFLGLHWLLVLIAIACIPVWYWFARGEDKINIEKFGGDYKRYMQRVPAMNFVAGLIRLRRKKK